MNYKSQGTGATACGMLRGQGGTCSRNKGQEWEGSGGMDGLGWGGLRWGGGLEMWVSGLGLRGEPGRRTLVTL